MDRDPVYLGYAESYDPSMLYQLRSCFFPLGKVGGKPSWLNPVHIPTSNQLQCKRCSNPLCFLMQVYATNDKDETHSFHRSLFFFICKDPKCSQVNDASNLAVFRCCLPRENPYYPSSNPPDPNFLTEEECPAPHPEAANLCEICGCFAAKRCGKCTRVYYCSREHQMMHWTKGGHRIACGDRDKHNGEVGGAEKEESTSKGLEESGNASTLNPANPFVFAEMGIEMGHEDLPGSLLEDLSDSEDEKDETEEDHIRRLEEYRKLVSARKYTESNDDDDNEIAEEKDLLFEKFNRIVALNPQQILRYQRNGEPLLATEKSTPLLDAVRPCELCHAPRTFEMQLMPFLLSLMAVDKVGESIDWASVFLFTCSQNCEIPSSGYAEEVVLKQDFE